MAVKQSNLGRAADLFIVEYRPAAKPSPGKEIQALSFGLDTSPVGVSTGILPKVRDLSE
jgi:hypothetical protein